MRGGMRVLWRCRIGDMFTCDAVYKAKGDVAMERSVEDLSGRDTCFVLRAEE
jgi:hypothetical protein